MVSPNSSAVGLAIGNFSFALALIKPTDTSDSSSYYGLSATASSVALVGMGTDFTLAVSGLSININGGTDAQDAGRVVDFATSLWNGATTAQGFLNGRPAGG